MNIFFFAIRTFAIFLILFYLFNPFSVIKDNFLSPEKKVERRIAFLIDLSDSIDIAALKKSVNAYYSKCKSYKYEVDIITFGDTVVRYNAFKNKLIQDGEFDSIFRSQRKKILPSGSNIRKALKGLLPLMNCQEKKDYLFLFTDGNETSNNISFNQLKQRKHPDCVMLTIPIGVKKRHEIWVQTIEGPEVTEKNAPCKFYFEIAGTNQTKFECTIMKGNKILRNYSAELDASLIHFGNFEDKITNDAKEVIYTVKIKPEKDFIKKNNTKSWLMRISEKKKLLYIGKSGKNEEMFLKALKAGKFQFDDYLSIRHKTLDWSKYNMIILNNLPYDYFSKEEIKAFARAVRSGAGFVMIGGDRSFNLGGYKNTEIEEILPVYMVPPKKIIYEPTGIVFVIDKSGSMATGAKMGAAKDATKEIVNFLTYQHIGIVSFESNYSVDVDLIQADGNWDQINYLISLIYPMGGTVFYAPLQEAIAMLESAPLKHRNIILLSDGRPSSREDSAVFQLIRDHSNKVTVSTVAVGRDADAIFLGSVADEGRGTFYLATDYSKIASIFKKEVKMIKSKKVIEKKIIPTVIYNKKVFNNISIKKIPELKGFNSVTPKKDAEVLLTAPTGETILAIRQLGISKTAVFTSDIIPRWGIEWLRWKNFPRFWKQLISYLVGKIEILKYNINVNYVIKGKKVVFTLDVFDNNGNFINNARAKLSITANGMKKIVTLKKAKEKGKYSATFMLKNEGKHIWGINIHEDGKYKIYKKGILNLFSFIEYQFSKVNELFLKKLDKHLKAVILLTPDVLDDLFKNIAIKTETNENKLNIDYQLLFKILLLYFIIELLIAKFIEYKKNIFSQNKGLKELNKNETDKIFSVLANNYMKQAQLYENQKIYSLSKDFYEKSQTYFRKANMVEWVKKTEIKLKKLEEFLN